VRTCHFRTTIRTAAPSRRPDLFPPRPERTIPGNTPAVAAVVQAHPRASLADLFPHIEHLTQRAMCFEKGAAPSCRQTRTTFEFGVKWTVGDVKLDPVATTFPASFPGVPIRFGWMSQANARHRKYRGCDFVRRMNQELPFNVKNSPLGRAGQVAHTPTRIR
jgi:hypothetical protein